MRYIITYIFLFAFLFASSQGTDSLTINGRVVQNEDLKPINYANIFIPKTKIGITSDSLGYFKIKFPDSLVNDTLVVSAMGFTRYKKCISDINLDKELYVGLEDSMYLLDEATALAYDNFEGLYWNTGKDKRKQYLTCATKELINVANFIKLLKSEFGEPRVKKNVLRWKRIKIRELRVRKAKITLTYLRCKYCPNNTDLNIVLYIRDRKNRNLLENKKREQKVEDYFQIILDKTFAQGIDYSFLEKRNDIAYLKNSTSPYSGKCFGYYKSGQKGLKGAYKNGKKTGPWIFWYKNGQPKMKASYVDGKKYGKWFFWYKNGTTRISSHYNKYGRMDGIIKWWYDNGQLKKKALFEDGVFIGKVEYSSKGKVLERVGNIEK